MIPTPATTSSPVNGTPDLPARVVELEARVAALERLIASHPQAAERLTHDLIEVPIPPWRHLVCRPRSWRRQLFIKGRNMTVRAVIGAMTAEQRTPEETASDLDIPVEAVREAVVYYDQNREAIDAETALELSSLPAGPRPPQ